MDLANVESQEHIPDSQIQLPVEVDLRYNVAVCTECCTGLAFDYIQGHLRSVHGIRKQLDAVMEDLNIEACTLSSVELRTWMSEVWVLDRAIQGVPVKEGMICMLCHHSGAREKAMKDHFAAHHQGMKWFENIEKCNVQMPFKGHLKKYIQIEDREGRDVEMDTGNDWKQALDQEFQETMAEHASSAAKVPSDIRLQSAFIAKARWNLCVKDMDMVGLQKLVAVPVRSDRLHKIILCGREYINKCCSALNGGNIMVKRRLMSAGYISRGDIY